MLHALSRTKTILDGPARCPVGAHRDAPSSREDGTAAPRLLDEVSAEAFPRRETIFGDNKYHNQSLPAWLQKNRPEWKVEVNLPSPEAKGFEPVRKRWVVERSNAWHGRCRRNSKDYERRPESSAAMIQISHLQVMLRKLAPTPRPQFNYSQTT